MKDTSLDNVQFQIDFGPTVQLSDAIAWIKDRYSNEDLVDIFDINLCDVCDDAMVLSETVSRYKFHEVLDSFAPDENDWDIVFMKDPDQYGIVKGIIQGERHEH